MELGVDERVLKRLHKDLKKLREATDTFGKKHAYSYLLANFVEWTNSLGRVELEIEYQLRVAEIESKKRGRETA